MLPFALKNNFIRCLLVGQLGFFSISAFAADDAVAVQVAAAAVQAADDLPQAEDEPIYSNECTRDRNPNEVTVLSYHEITTPDKALDTTYAVSGENFAAQMKWLHDNGYHFVSVDDVIAHKMHKKKLPEKAVMVTFDDGYRSVYDNAWSTLKKYKIPFVDALVGSWLKPKSGKVKHFGDREIDRSYFLTQAQIKEMLGSGLMSLGSHTFDAHHGVQGNPQGNSQPAMTTRIYHNGKYETETAYKQRVYADLKANNTFLKAYTGTSPKIIVWPYGRYNIETRTAAARLGMLAGLTLDDGSNTRKTPLWGLRRVLVEHDFSLAGLQDEIKSRNANYADQERAVKAAHVDLDYIYDKNPEQENANLGALLDRLQQLGVNTVYLQAFSDPDANGAADAVYFPNPYIPMRHDLFNRVAWQITSRTPVTRVYAWMPLLAWELPNSNPVSKQKVLAVGKDGGHLNMGYPRLSPFSPQVRKIIGAIYQSLGRYATIDGVLFHDDATLSDYEDDSPWARAQYRKWGLPESVSQIRANKAAFAKWTALKTDYIDRFALKLASDLNEEQPELKTARNLYAQVVLNPNAEEWYAQSLPKSIRRYDFTAIMAMPYMEQAEDKQAFYRNIAHKVQSVHCGDEKAVIELQTVNWRDNDKPLPTDELTQTIHNLYRMGVNHIAYYPDNVFINNPDKDAMRKAFSEQPLRLRRSAKNKKG